MFLLFFLLLLLFLPQPWKRRKQRLALLPPPLRLVRIHFVTPKALEFQAHSAALAPYDSPFRYTSDGVA